MEGALLVLQEVGIDMPNKKLRKIMPDKRMETYLPYEDRELRPYEKPMKEMYEMIPPYKTAKKPMEKIEKVLPYETALPKKNLKKMMKK